MEGKGDCHQMKQSSTGTIINVKSPLFSVPADRLDLPLCSMVSSMPFSIWAAQFPFGREFCPDGNQIIVAEVSEEMDVYVS